MQASITCQPSSLVSRPSPAFLPLGGSASYFHCVSIFFVMCVALFFLFFLEILFFIFCFISQEKRVLMRASSADLPR